MTNEAGPNIVYNGLVLYLDAANSRSYPGSGTTCSDLSANKVSGTLISGTTYSSANNGNFVLNGTSSYITLPNFKNSFDFNSPFTISAWVNKTNTNIADIVSTYVSEDGIWLEIQATTNRIRFVSRKLTVNVFDFVSLEAISINAWQNIVATFDGATAKIYINEVQSVHSASATTLFSVVNNDLTIGRLDSFYGRYFPGSIGPISIYNRAITAAEVKQNFNATKGRYGL